MFRPAALPHVVRSMNTTAHSSLPNRKSPAQVVFGRQSRLFQQMPSDLDLGQEDDEAVATGQEEGQGDNQDETDEFDGIEDVPEPMQEAMDEIHEDNMNEGDEQDVVEQVPEESADDSRGKRSIKWTCSP